MSTAPATEPFALEAPAIVPLPFRQLRRGLRWHGDQSNQLDPERGCPEAQVPQGHPVRHVIEWVEHLELSSFRARLRPLGRTPVDPKFKLRAWLYGSLIGIHSASALSRLSHTDAALRLAAGGRSLSESSLKDFRADHATALENLMQQVLGLGMKAKLVDPRALAVDSMRLRADVATSKVRTVVRSTKQLNSLKSKDISTLSESEKVVHNQKVADHQAVLDRCAAEDRTSFALTDPQAALMKFPSGAYAPGHRIQAVASGSSERFIVCVLVNGAPNDCGQLRVAVTAGRDALLAAGAVARVGAAPMQIAADAGYMSEDDLAFISEQRAAGRIDVIVPAPVQPKPTAKDGTILYGNEDFKYTPGATESEKGKVVCPADKPMTGPSNSKDGRHTWRGVGCADCPLKAKCTKGKFRKFSINPATHLLRKEVTERMSEDGARARYHKRIATVEPVFGFVQDAMLYQRASSRRTETVKAEVLLKAIAYNISRLAAAAAKAPLRVLAVLVSFDPQGRPQVELLEGQ
jgi:transposase